MEGDSGPEKLVAPLIETRRTRMGVRVDGAFSAFWRKLRDNGQWRGTVDFVPPVNPFSLRPKTPACATIAGPAVVARELNRGRDGEGSVLA